MNMKKSMFLAICAMAVMISCKTGNSRESGAGLASAEDSATVDNTAAEVSSDIHMDSLKTDTVSYEKSVGILNVSLWAEYPVEGRDSLVKKVREFINDFMGGAYDGSLADGQKMIDENGVLMFNSLQEECGDVDEEDVNELFLHKTVSKGYETNTFVTFMATSSSYMGGLHGIGHETGQTFSKANGQSFGYDMMKNTDSPAFKRLIKEGLKMFFGDEKEGKTMSDEDLLEELVSYSGSADELPLPDSEPYMTEGGITFIYQPYEISYYAAGKPEFTIPYDAVKPYLKPQAIELFLDK